MKFFQKKTEEEKTHEQNIQKPEEEKKENPEQEQRKIMDACPGCKESFKAEDVEKKIIAVRIGIFLSNENVAPSLPACICLICGNVFFPKVSLGMIRDQLAKKGEGSRIIKTKIMPTNNKLHNLIKGRSN